MARDTRKPLRAGDLQHRMHIIAPAGTEAIGETVVEADVAAQISVLPPQFQPREALDLSALQTQTAYIVSLRMRTDLRASYVLRETCCTLREFQILSMVPSDHGDALDVTCVTSG